MEKYFCSITKLQTLTMKKNNIFRLLLLLTLCSLGTHRLMAQDERKMITMVLKDPVTGDSSEYEVINLSFTIAREEADSSQKSPLQADITVTLASRSGKHILQWMANPDKGLNGKIMTKNLVNGKIVQEMSFTDTRIGYLAGNLAAGDYNSSQTQLSLILGPQLTIDGVPFRLKSRFR